MQKSTSGCQYIKKYPYFQQQKKILIISAGSYIKLDAQVVHCDLDSPRHWIRLSDPVKHNVYCCL